MLDRCRRPHPPRCIEDLYGHQVATRIVVQNGARLVLVTLDRGRIGEDDSQGVRLAVISDFHRGTGGDNPHQVKP